MLTRVNFANDGLVALVSLERRNALILRHNPSTGKFGEPVGAVVFNVVDSGLGDRLVLDIYATRIPYPKPSAEEGIFSDRESKAQRKAQRKARKRTIRANRIDDNIVSTLTDVFTRQLLATQ